MTLSPSTEVREAGPSRQPSRLPGRRLSATHVLLAIVVILAFVLNMLVLQDRGDTTLVAVASRPLAAGSALADGDIRLIPVSASFEGFEGLVTEEQVSGLTGNVLRSSFDEGELIRAAEIASPELRSGFRSMSIPIPIEHAVGGAIAVGDRVDVISVVDGASRYVAADLEVIGVSAGDGASIGISSSFHVVVAVNGEEALAIAGAIDSGALEIVRSTGAEPLPGLAGGGS